MLVICLAILLPVLLGAFLIIKKADSKLSYVVYAGSATVLALCVCAVVTKANGVLLHFASSMTIAFRADGVGSFFAILVCVMFALSSIYAIEYTEHDEQKSLFFGWTLVTLGAMIGLSFADNMFTFYMFFEIMSLASFPLVLYNKTDLARKAATKYLGFSVFGASLVLAGLMLCGSVVFSSFSAGGNGVAKTGTAVFAFLLIAIGFSCKAGMLPLSAWLPTAHPEAPAPASALLSGVITKAGILGILRATYFVFGTEMLSGSYAQTIVLILSILTIFVGSMLAYKEKLIKKRLAFSSVSQLSYIIFGLMLFNNFGLIGALLQVAFHSAAKVGLFLCAGAIIHKTGLTRVDELKAIAQKMPIVMSCFAVFSLSLIGIPPLGGFVSKWNIAVGAFNANSIIGIVGVVVLLISALLTAGYLMPIVTKAFFSGETFGVEKCEPKVYMIAPLLILAFGLIVFGIFPTVLLNLFNQISIVVFGGVL